MIAGGSGVVPFRAMLRLWAEGERKVPARLLYSSRTLEDVIYREEFERLEYDGAEVHLTLTRQWPAHWQGHRGRVDDALLAEVGWPPEHRPRVYVCGPTAFVETVAQALVAAGHEPGRIKTERFGPTGT
jgi:ferredoxin-NADP reductase